MSSESAPLPHARFAEALRELPAASLALKVLELRNSITHLDYSNAELKPFAEGRTPTLGATGPARPDQDCIDAIAENEAVIGRFQHRIELIRAEVESRGLSWAEFQIKEDEEQAQVPAAEGEEATPARQQEPAATSSSAAAAGGGLTNGVNGHAPAPAANGEHPAWQDGTFQTGTIGGLGDEELLRRLQERMPELMREDGEGEDDNNGGLHL